MGFYDYEMRYGHMHMVIKDLKKVVYLIVYKN